MNELDELKTPKRILKNITFQHDNAALSYTTQGAASLKDKAYLFKSLNEVDKELSEEAVASDGDNTRVNQAVSKSNDIKLEGDQMSDQNVEVAALHKQLKVMKLEKTLAKYGLADDVELALAETMADVEDATGIFKALDALQEAGKVALDKAQEAVAAKVEEEKTELQKSLDAEAGHQDTAAPVAKSLVMQAAEILDEKGAK